MATYADGTTIAEVGDIVKCVVTHGAAFKKLNDYSSYKVVKLAGDSVYLEFPDGHAFLCSRFELVKRTGAAAPSPPPEPLVKWPEEKRLTWPNLEVGEWFAFDREGINDAACLRVGDGYVAMFAAGTSNAILPGSRDYPVRRLRMIQPPKFEVI